MTVTFLVGYVTTTRRHIESVFGSPTWDTTSPDGKVTTEWRLTLDGDTAATIYDYKRYEEGAPALDETYEWHIGGTGVESADLVMKKLGIEGSLWI